VNNEDDTHHAIGQLAACLSAVEIALCYQQYQRKSSKNGGPLSAAFSKLRKYRT